MGGLGIGAQLRALRLDRGYTLEQLAEVSGVSVRGISDIERGIRDRPRRSTIDALCNALEVDDSMRRELTRHQPSRNRTDKPIESVQPHRVFDFIGRQAEYRLIAAHLTKAVQVGQSRTVILAGPPGMGKTALAIEATQRLREPGSLPLYLDLLGPNPALARQPLAIVQGLLRQLPGSRNEDQPMELDACVAKWRAACESHQFTVVLDNAAEEAQVRPVLAGGNLRVVITCRRSLAGIEDVLRIHLDALPSGESIEMINRIVPPAQRTDEDVVELARLCGDLPLALRIAANRIASQPTQTAAAFVRRMSSDDRRLRALVAGDLSAEAAFKLSYDDLDPFTAAVFRNLCLVYGLMFDVLQVAVLMDCDPLDAEESLGELVELGLVELIGENLYRLHDLLRLFSAHQLHREEDEAGSAAQARLRSWLLSAAAVAGGLFNPHADSKTAERADLNSDRIRANRWLQRMSEHWWPAYKQAAELGNDRAVLAVAESFHWYSDTWVSWNNWHRLFALSVAAARNLEDRQSEALQLCHLAWAELVELDTPAAALETSVDAVAAANDADDDLARGWALYYRGWAENGLHRPERAIDSLKASASAFERIGHLEGVVQAQSLASDALRASGNPRAAIDMLRRLTARVMTVHERSSEPVWVQTRILAHIRIADGLLDLARPTEALREAAQGVSLAETASWVWGLGRCHLMAARAAQAMGDNELMNDHIESGMSALAGNTEALPAVIRADLEDLRLE